MSDHSEHPSSKESSTPNAVNAEAEARQSSPPKQALTETGSSVIIDMGQLGEPSARTDKPEPIIAPMMSHPDLDRITFSDLEAFVPNKEPPAVIEKPVIPVYEPPVDDVVDVRPPSLTRFLLIIFIFLLAGVASFAGWRLDWDWTLLRNDPVLALNVIAGIQQKPAPPIVRPPAPPPPEQMRGELKIQKLTLQATDERSKKKSLVVRGIVNNATNRVQRAIMLKVSIVTQTGTSLDSKRHACCRLTPKSGDDAQGASPQGGVQGSKPTQEAVLKPGQTAAFEVVFEDRSEAVGELKPQAEVTFFESERAP